jgi:hypothetical protein
MFISKSAQMHSQILSDRGNGIENIIKMTNALFETGVFA